MTNNAQGHDLKRLLIGLVDQEVLKGTDFYYDGGRLHADEVGSLLLPSVLCIAQDVASRVGMGTLGFSFALTSGGSPYEFPLAMRAHDGVLFSKVAPFVVEVFEGEVMECRHDLARLFEAAAKLVDPTYDLATRSNYADLSM